jgi:hypothetical protein
MAELQLLLVAVQKVIINDDIEVDLIDEYANQHYMDNKPRCCLALRLMFL